MPEDESACLPDACATPVKTQKKSPAPSGPWPWLPRPLLVLLGWLTSSIFAALLPQELLNLGLLSLCPAKTPPSTRRRWTLRRLQQWLQEHLGQTYCLETLRQALRRLRFSWKKARKLLTRADPLARFLFLHQLQPLLEQAQQGKMLLVYIDEAHIHCDTDLGYAWGTRGEPLLVPSSSPGLSFKTTLYGIYVLPLAKVHIWPAPRANTDHTLEILRRLRETYPAQPLTLLWDGASYHRSQVVHDLAAQLRITLVPLAGYSPDFMPVEALWRWLRQQVTGNYCHDSIAALLESITAFEAAINLDPAALARRLTCKNSLNFVEEELRFSKWN